MCFAVWWPQLTVQLAGGKCVWGLDKELSQTLMWPFQLLNLTQLLAGLRRSWFKDDGIFWEVVGTSRSTSSRISRPMCGFVF